MVVAVVTIVASVASGVAQAISSSFSSASAPTPKGMETCDFSVKTPSGLSIEASTWDLLILGTEIQNETTITFDCWKPVLRDPSTTPSSGKVLKEIMEDARMKQVVVKEGEDENRPDVRLVNIWGDQFDIEYVVLPTGHLALHAVPAA